MRFIEPRTGAKEVTIAEEQEEYQPITVALYSNSNYPGATEFLVRLTLTPEERAQVASGEDIFISELCWDPNDLDTAKFTPLTVTVGMQHWKVDPPIEESHDKTK